MASAWMKLRLSFLRCVVYSTVYTTLCKTVFWQMIDVLALCSLLHTRHNQEEFSSLCVFRSVLQGV